MVQSAVGVGKSDLGFGNINNQDIAYYYKVVRIIDYEVLHSVNAINERRHLTGIESYNGIR